jgi:type IX secretion system PorP/SprF family membrane protein
MRNLYLLIIFFFCSTQLIYSQEDGVVSFALPVRNSLKFNRYLINPTFSFVREQGSYLSFYNKRQWIQFDNAPETYLFGYSGRFKENEGIAIGLFQQNYGILTTFGAVTNFAHNVVLDTDSNLTFGLNVGLYKSGLNKGKVVSGYDDPSLDNIPSSFLATINPGINYGTAFLDFGASVNNLILYNIKTSEIIQDNPERSIELHMMHTGYLDTYGFFDRSKFSALLKTELKKEKTVVSGLIMLAVPNGMWAQAGYNTLYGMSAGLGLNLTSKISLEYNFEKATGNLSNFGSSHEITLAYKFKSNNYYHDEEDNEGAIITPKVTKKYVASKSKTTAVTKSDAKITANEKAKAATDARAKLLADAKIKADARAKQVADARAKAIETRDKLLADNKAKREALAQTKLPVPAQNKTNSKIDKTKAEQEAKAKLAADAKLKAEEEAKTKLAAEAKAKTDAIAQAKLAADAKLKAEEEAKAKLAAEAKAKADAIAQAKLAADAKLKAEEEAKAKLAAEVKAKVDSIAQAKLAADAKLKAEEEAKAKLAAEAKAKTDAIAQAKLAAEAKLKAEEEAKAKLAAEVKAKADSIAKAKEEVVVTPTDDNAKSMENLIRLIREFKVTQQQLLKKLNRTVSDKEKDLKDLKEENDLSEKGIFRQPKPFKSVSAENSALFSLNSEIEELNKNQKEKIAELEGLYQERLKKGRNKTDETTQYYLKLIESLKEDQTKVIQTNNELLSSLEEIKKETEIEKKRRIKRASFENDESRYLKDLETLKRLKATTPISDNKFKPEDFDYGDEQASMQILKNIKNVETGYYLIIAVHNTTDKRDTFLTKTLSSGQRDIDFFYDVNSSKYFIYYNKFNTIEQAKRALETKGSTPYNGKMVIVKVEN